MKTLEKKKILLAEDDTSMRRFIEITLQKAGFEVLTAEDGLTAMQFSLENEFDAIVADAIMPNMNGYELCRMVRANSAVDKKIPCIMLSGLSENDGESDLADVFLTKDTNLKNQLLDALQKLL
jgi:CheY-like chemotaxis protein